MPVSEIREPTFLILASLASGEQHGYGIMREVNTTSGGRVVMRAGTLYAALDRLVAEGLITASGSEVVNGRNRRYYGLTDEGVGILETEVQRMRTNANRAASCLRALGVEAYDRRIHLSKRLCMV
jgi:PadR family transcriptional regulator PadR